MSIPPASLQPQHIEQIYTGIYNEMNKKQKFFALFFAHVKKML